MNHGGEPPCLVVHLSDGTVAAAPRTTSLTAVAGATNATTACRTRGCGDALVNGMSAIFAELLLDLLRSLGVDDQIPVRSRVHRCSHLMSVTT